MHESMYCSSHACILLLGHPSFASEIRFSLGNEVPTEAPIEEVAEELEVRDPFAGLMHAGATILAISLPGNFGRVILVRIDAAFCG